MWKLLDKIRQKPVRVRKTIGAVIVTALMLMVVWLWFLNLRDNFIQFGGKEPLTPYLDAPQENQSAIPKLQANETPQPSEISPKYISPWQAFKENLSALKNAPEVLQKGEAPHWISPSTQPDYKKTGGEASIINFFKKAWRYIYEPLK